MKRVLLFGIISLLMLAGTFSGSMAQSETAAPTLTPAPTPTPFPKPAPMSLIEENGVTLALYFPSIPQGQTGIIEVQGEGIVGARVRFLNEMLDFFPGSDGGLYAILSVGMEQTPRNYELAVFAWDADDQRVTVNTEITVVLGRFIREDITLPPDRSFLVDAEIERSELARMESIFSTHTPERGWDEFGFQYPILNSSLTSPFGVFRTFNGTLRTRHTGWDIRTILGNPILASAGGTVAYAGLMDIRGNMVTIDHGHGVFSTYSHLSQIHVTRGQSIIKGQIIGTTGDTGRSSGPHFHWEMAVNGEFIDSDVFINTWQP